MKQSQADKILELLQDLKPHRGDEIMEYAYGKANLGWAKPTARISELRKAGHNVKCLGRDKQIKTLSWYQLLPKEEKLYTIKDTGLTLEVKTYTLPPAFPPQKVNNQMSMKI